MPRRRNALDSCDWSPAGGFAAQESDQKPIAGPWYTAAQFAPASVRPSFVDTKVGSSNRARLKPTQGAITTSAANTVTPPCSQYSERGAGREKTTTAPSSGTSSRNSTRASAATPQTTPSAAARQRLGRS